ncbi:PAS/PAC sensor hybrid histidine kinase [Anaeromyxobacter dehalogenans 2CP-1]|uniref:histidine kinase n=1 Tax=Anaeromyxobacter dehalogenans (strain ATCC BAA-258 / DSM 21875 / 2CP-1) TaxID=455488 RepID=B8J6A8_ANAD2|nr:ATP-binding protein [Anaeromyxobacter dehalogenans]ACL65089.1 PAS/PAC sensor hybrid histidine kinase [Anaeromyxobacter dehalogenans 2CP-1]
MSGEEQRTPVPAWASSRAAPALVVAVAIIDLLAVLLVGSSVEQSRLHQHERATAATQNLAAALEQYLGGIFEKVELTLLTVADEYARESAAGRLDAPVFDDFLARQRGRIPQVHALEVFDANGVLAHGRDAPPGVISDISDREYFRRLRDDPGLGVLVSSPLVGRLTARPQLVMARALRRADGGFAGVAVASVLLEDLAHALEGYDVGARGVIVLRDPDLGVVVRRQSSGAPIALGDRTVSPELLALLRDGHRAATYSGVAVDGVERTFTFRRMARTGHLVIVGLACDDYLAGWRRSTLLATAVLAAFGLLTAAAAWLTLRAWRRHQAAVQDLAEQETRFRLLAESATDVIWMVDAARRLTYVSPAVQRLAGWTPEEACRVRWPRLLSRPSIERIRSALARLGAVAPHAQPFADALIEHEVVAKDGRRVHAESRFSLLWSADGQVLGAIGVTRDVTERREMQARVQVAERMASLGTMAAGVAHEVNNPLTYVYGNVAFALERLRSVDVARGRQGPVDEALQALREALAGADRVRHIVRDLKAFSRAEDGRLEPVDVGQVIEGCLKMTATLTGDRAQVSVRLGPVPRVLASEARIGQVMLNLIVNAAHAIPEGDPDANRIEVSTALAADGRVEVVVTDTGTGIAPEVLPRIFDPFFTTKGVGEGTGLGLSICHGIVKGLDGEIDVETAVGRGSRFRVLLPPAPEGAVAAPAEAPIAPAAPPRRRVLVLDDDPLVARAIGRTLSRDCAVDVSTDPVQALRRVHSGERWDVILCDLMMPELAGMDVHASIQEIDPGQAARIVFMTGGAFTTRAREFLERVPNARLEKPLDPATLARVLEAGGRGAPGDGTAGR